MTSIAPRLLALLLLSTSACSRAEGDLNSGGGGALGDGPIGNAANSGTNSGASTGNNSGANAGSTDSAVAANENNGATDVAYDDASDAGNIGFGGWSDEEPLPTDGPLYTVAIGEACTSDEECSSGACTDLKYEGFRRCHCDDDADCSSETSDQVCQLTTIGRNNCLAGGIDLGDDCDKDIQCLSGNCSAGFLGLEQTGQGSCQCDSDADCGSGFICWGKLGLHGSPEINPNFCLPSGLEAGEICYGSASDAQCESGDCSLYANDDGDHVCNCKSDADCGSGHCYKGTDPNVCIPTGQDLGETCVNDIDCDSGNCTDDITPGNRTCQCDDDNDCSGSQVCKTSTNPNTCVSGGLSVGASCSIDSQCRSGACSDVLDTCMCTSDIDCGSGKICAENGLNPNTCVTGNLGNACQNDSQCRSGSCTDGFSGPKVCQCNDDNDCSGSQECKTMPNPNRCQ